MANTVDVRFNERRQDRRISPALTVDIDVNGKRQVSAVRNISVRGIAFECALKPKAGEILAISLEGFGDVDVRIIWAECGIVAGVFELDDTETQRLSACLDKLGPKVRAPQAY